jgi:RNA polymerase sigma-70 factor, ECF subfamily
MLPPDGHDGGETLFSVDRRNIGGNFSSPRRVPICEPAVNDDAQLIDQTLAGHAAAFGQLVLKYQDRLYNTVLHVAGNAEDARDIVQDAFVHAFTKLDGFQQSSAFYTWLYRIAFNVASSRRRRRRPVISVEHARETAGLEPIDGGEGPAERVERQERCRQVRQAIDALGEEHRLVLVLREIDGFCYETIADILDLPIGTVRSRLHRARLQLREQLKEVLITDQ